MANEFDEDMIARWIAGGLRKYPDYNPEPAMPSHEIGRPKQADLYELMGTLQGKPIDYSGVQRVAKSRSEQARTDFMGGLALQTLGGKRMSPAGAAVLKQALDDSQPLRANAADVGYYDPQTGEFVENPQAARTREEKVLANAIAAQDKRDQTRAQIARDIALYGQRGVQMENRDITTLTGQLRAAEDARRAAEARVAAAETKANARKPATPGELDKMRGLSSAYAEMSDVMGSYKPSYAGDITGAPGSAVERAVWDFNPELALRVLPQVGLSAEQVRNSYERDQWWRKLKDLDELPRRNAAFGATLTAGERAEWAAATPQRKDTDETIQRYYKTRMAILQRKMQEVHDTAIANQRDPETVRSVLRMTPEGGFNVNPPQTPPISPPQPGTAQPPSAAPVAPPPAPQPGAGGVPSVQPGAAAPAPTMASGGGSQNFADLSANQPQRDMEAAQIRARERSPQVLAADIAEIEKALSGRLDGTQRGILATELRLLKMALQIHQQAGGGQAAPAQARPSLDQLFPNG